MIQQFIQRLKPAYKSCYTHITGKTLAKIIDSFRQRNNDLAIYS